MAQDEELVEITGLDNELVIDLAYAGAGNLTGQVIYEEARCLLHRDAAACLRRAAGLALLAGLRLKVFDAYRPPAAQDRLWRLLPDSRYVADARVGSNHSRGVAVDVTLVNGAGKELDMGTAFDAMLDASHHLAPGLPPAVHRNRFLLLGLMAQAGFRPIDSEWWHYELPDARTFPLVLDGRIRCRES